MENREKMFCFTAAVTNSSLKMPPTSYMKPAAVTITPNQSDYFEFQQQDQQLQHYSVSSTTNDPYATYTDNFDLSLLPQDCANGSAIKKASSSQIPADAAADIPTNLVDNIPTTVFNFDTNREEQKSELITVPEIKIEQTWSSCPSLNTVKQEQTYHSYFPKQNQLIPPPPAYPVHIYPSPQSSPAQSEYGFPQSQYSGCYESLGSSRNSLCGTASSPCPSIDVHSIKQEQLHILPPSPPESSCDTPTPQSGYTSASGFDFKSEPFDSDAETFNDLNTSPKTSPGNTVSYLTTADTSLTKQDHQLLREYLEDTTFQKQHNLKPLALDSFIGDLNEVRDNFEPVISLALEHAKREADATCAKLQISQDPSDWSPNQVQAWLRSTIQQFHLPSIDDLETKFNENGTSLLQLTEEEFARRIPRAGGVLHAQLEIWKLTYSDDCHKNANGGEVQLNDWKEPSIPATFKNEMEEDTEDEDHFLPNPTNNSTGNISITDQNKSNCLYFNNEEITTNTDVPAQVPQIKRPGARNGGSHIHLWQFLKELLAAPHVNGTAIRWIDRTKGIFKIEDSVRVAKLWGKRKNRPAMNYDKLSRSIRQYYKKGIMKKTERSQRLVYQFCQPYHM